MANVTYSSFTSEASPQDTDQVVGYRTATVGGERRTALSVLRTFFKATYDTLYATLASPAFTGTPTAPTATGGTNTTQLATTAFVLANSGGATSVTAASTFGTDNVMLRSDGTGRGSQSSGVTVDDSNNIGGIATLSATTLTPTSITWGTIVVPDANGATGIVINDQTASYTLAATDVGKLVRINNASANNWTVPPNSSVAIAVGKQITGEQVGAGLTTVVAGSGVTVNSRGTALKSGGQFAQWVATKTATDVWTLSGDITP